MANSIVNFNSSVPTPPVANGVVQFITDGGSPVRNTIATLPPFGASGGSHSPGAVPDPGSVAGILRFLREDSTWQLVTGASVPAAGSDTNIQVNSAGLFYGDSGFTYDHVAHLTTITNPILPFFDGGPVYSTALTTNSKINITTDNEHSEEALNLRYNVVYTAGLNPGGSGILLEVVDNSTGFGVAHSLIGQTIALVSQNSDPPGSLIGLDISSSSGGHSSTVTGIQIETPAAPDVGSIDTATGILINDQAGGGTGDTGTSYGIHIASQNPSIATTAYGIRIEDFIGTGWAIKTGKGSVYFGDKIIGYNNIPTVSGGVPAEYAKDDRVAQTAAIPANTLYAVPVGGAGMYRISYVAKVTTPATTSSVLGGANGLQIVYTDNDDSVVVTTAAGPTSNLNTTQAQINGSIIVNAKASTNIQYSIGYTSVGATPMAFALHVKVEAL